MKSANDMKELYQAKGLRLTRPRRIIMQVLGESTDHPDAIELHRRVALVEPGVSIATVYRTLALLEEKGALERHMFSDGRARYEPADTKKHHDHLINIETGDVIEFHSEEIEQLQQKIARRHGYEIVSHRLEIYVTPIEPRRKSKNGKPAKKA
jgi:Fur family ferric uptake transcriptional regulator